MDFTNPLLTVRIFFIYFFRMKGLPRFLQNVLGQHFLQKHEKGAFNNS